ncbi:MAG: c-type cytochrome biogenesis protein CcmI, partial [Pseudomonadota bacterium]
MVLWIALAVLLALSLGALLWPLFSRNAPEGGGEDREVYAAQLEEMEADRARGLIGDADAAAARAEIARRLLRARDGSGAAGTRRRTAMVVALCVGVFVPAFSLGAYLFLGAPDYGDLPLAARTAPVTDEELERLLVRAEARLGEDPDDARGWMAVAPIYQRLGRFEDAANAFGRLNALAGDNAQWLSAQGESLTFASEGEV